MTKSSSGRDVSLSHVQLNATNLSRSRSRKTADINRIPTEFPDGSGFKATCEFGDG